MVAKPIHQLDPYSGTLNDASELPVPESGVAKRVNVQKFYQDTRSRLALEYEQNSNTNKFTDAEKNKLAALSNAASQTDVFNATGGTLTVGTPVSLSTIYNSGAGAVEVIVADASNDLGADGLVAADITDQTLGQIVLSGVCSPFNTTGFLVGEELYLDEGGGITNQPPSTGYIQRIGKCVVSGASGAVLVKAFGVDHALTDGDAIDDNNGDELLAFGVPAAGTHANHLKVTASVAGQPVIIEPEGEDASIDLLIRAKNGSVLVGDQTPVQLTSSGGSVTYDVSGASDYYITLTENTSFNLPSGLTAGKRWVINCYQNGTGNWVPSFPSHLIESGTTFPTTPNSTWTLQFLVDDQNNVRVASTGSFA